MCGLLTVLDPTGALTHADLEPVATLRSRGPHDERTWVDERGTVGMGHTRLAIVGVDNGAQPIASPNGEVVAVVTGELYPSLELRKSLETEGHRFSTDSDSELVVHLYEDDPDRFCERVDGEFAFVVWDRRRQRVLAGRDRFGVKPLFVARLRDRWVVASLAKTLFAAGVERRWDERSYADHLAISMLPGASLFDGVEQVEPGQIVTWSLDRVGGSWSRSARTYWSIPVPRSGHGDEGDADGEIAATLRAAVDDRLVADVPVAVHLSGGLDSTVIAGLVAARGSSTTFTVRFPGPFDEGAAAARTAAALGTEHRELPFTAADYLAARRRTMAVGEMIQENGHGTARLLLSEHIASSGYRVALAGEGADELFYGYGSLQRDLLLGLDEGQRGAASNRQRRHRSRLPSLVGQVFDRLGLLPAWVLERQAHVVLPLLPLLAPNFRDHHVRGRPPSERIDRLLDDIADLPFGAVSNRLFLRTWFVNYLLAAERLDLDGKVELRLPYLAGAVAELALGLPLALHRPDPDPKPVLRRSLPLPPTWAPPADKVPFQAQPMVEDDRVMDSMITDVEAGLLDAVPMLDETACLGYLRSVRRLAPRSRTAHDRVVHLVYSTGLLGDELDLRG